MYRALTPVLLVAMSAKIGPGQTFARPALTAADWTAVAKLPDFTGIWGADFGGGGRGAAAQRQPRGVAGADAAIRPAQASDSGRGGGRDQAKGGRGAAGPALTPEYSAKAKAPPVTNEDSNAARCLPPGLPGIMSQPYPYEFLMTPRQVTIISEAYCQARRIYTDGRPLASDPGSTFFGTSMGHWEGETLVAETIEFAQVPRGLNFSYSEKMKIVERFRLTDPNTMTIETTILDPEALQMPFGDGPTSMPFESPRGHRIEPQLFVSLRLDSQHSETWR